MSIIFAIAATVLIDVSGATNPDVTQANIRQTICVSGWTKTVRPPVSYTTRLKIKQLRLLGLDGVASDYVEDHVLPLEIGGHPTDEKNLQPEPVDGPNNAHDKDKVENRLHREVCSGRKTLKQVQLEMLEWIINHPANWQRK